jgi:AcrR family transcriptional regulator
MIHDTNQPTTRRQRKRQERKAAFVDIAYVIVENEGLDRLTMPKLAKEADVAVGGLYRYFDGKEALIAALQIRASRSFVDFVDRRLEALGAAGPLDVVRAIVMAWSEFLTESPEEHFLLDSSLSSPAVLLSDEDALEVAQGLRPVFQRCATALGEAARLGLLEKGDAQLRTHALWAAVHGVGHFTKRNRLLPERLHAARVREELIRTLLVGWGAELSA